MSVTLAPESLTVFVDGTETPGVIIYGLSGPAVATEQLLLPSQTLDVARARRFILTGRRWRIVGWDVPFATWRSRQEMCGDVRATLAELIRRGFTVSWVGCEGLPFSSPPRLFDPDEMSGGALAWMTSDAEFGCTIEPDQPFLTADRSVLTALRQHAAGLADAD